MKKMILIMGFGALLLIVGCGRGMDVTSPVPADRIAISNSDPNLISPPDGYVYQVWSNVKFEWAGDPGYDGRYYLDTKLNGIPMPAFSGIKIGGTSLTLDAVFMDKRVDYGTWQWRVYTKDGPSGPYHYSDWWTFYKNPPELLTPADGATVNDKTLFSWGSVPSIDPPHTWYIAKVTGPSLSKPVYTWSANNFKGYMPSGFYDYLRSLGGGEFTWTIAAARGCPKTSGGLGMSSGYASSIKYPPARTFFIAP